MSSSVSPERLPLTTSDLAAERLARLRELLPGAFAEGKIVPERLAELVGSERVTSTPERYGLSYAGRTEALREMLAPSTGTLRPVRAASVAWDTAENLIIEGDNLHVLKLLQSAYAGAVKLIYLDPPYNTGNDFVYPDNFRSGIAHYKAQTQQTLSTNPETSGRYHSDWLKMMHPRLALARNLLRNDGVIFVAIDDHEVANLRLLMDEVFGEENFVGQLIWKRRQTVDSRASNGVSTDHEYVVAYSRFSARLRGKQIDLSKFSNPDNDPRGEWWSADLTGLATREERPNLHYGLVNPATGVSYPPPENGWRYAPDTMARLIAEQRILWPAKPSGRPRLKRFRREPDQEFTNLSSVLDTVYTTQGTRALKELFEGDEVLGFPKPVELLRLLVEQVASSGDLILDFFAGSGTTGQAVLELNRQDGGNRRFILVQFPEKTGRTDFPTIADITRERVRRVIQRRPADFASGAAEGFRAYRLEESNFKLWDGENAPRDAEGLAKQLELMVHNVVDGRTDDDLLAEILLKCGHPGITLHSPAEVRDVAGQSVHLLAAGALAICLGRALTREVLRGIVALAPKRVLCLDIGFQGSDELKTNTVLEMKSHGIQLQTV